MDLPLQPVRLAQKASKETPLVLGIFALNDLATRGDLWQRRNKVALGLLTRNPFHQSQFLFRQIHSSRRLESEVFKEMWTIIELAFLSSLSSQQQSPFDDLLNGGGEKVFRTDFFTLFGQVFLSFKRKRNGIEQWRISHSFSFLGCGHFAPEADLP